MGESGTAVFVSSSSQDASVAQKISAALQQAGIEVWFDKSDFMGSEAWEQKIQEQIKSCALFIPVVSASTQARRDGYFRMEWDLAAQRVRESPRARPFLLPVLIDGTAEPTALVPPEFRGMQWTKLCTADAFSRFRARVQALLVPPRVAEAELEPATLGSATPMEITPRQQRTRGRTTLLATLALTAAAFVIFAGRRCERKTNAEPAARSPAVGSMTYRLAYAADVRPNFDQDLPGFPIIPGDQVTDAEPL